MGELAILVPVLRRPHRVKPLVRSITQATPDARVLFLCDPDDTEEIDAVLAHSSADFICPGGNYASKINRGIELTQEPLLFLGADDLEFHPGWFEAAKAKLTDTIGVVGTQDLCNERTLRGEHATHCLVARWYTELGTIDGQDGLLFEGYAHEYVDDELVGTAKARNAWAFAEDAIVEHLHPMVGKAPVDDLYAAQEGRMRQSWPTFRHRRKLWTAQL